MSFLFPARRTEATNAQLAASGAWGGGGIDPLDGDIGYRRIGDGPREVPSWTLEKARSYGVAAYRTNPMARAVLDTYTSFIVGDAGLALQCTNPEVRKIAEAFWTDPRNGLGDQELSLRSHMLMGETAQEMMVGQTSGIVRRNPISVERITGVTLEGGNPLWPAQLEIRMPGAENQYLTVVALDDLTGLRMGEVMFWRSWRALETDRRGFPFLGPILDWLDSYDRVLTNLVDRTALARYMVHDVTITGGQPEVDAFLEARGGAHAPRSGTMEVHNDKVKWEVMTAEVGAHEDTTTAASMLTNVAAGAGLAKTWLAEPEDSNRATSLTMAEPVRRRVGGVQNMWVGYQTDQVRYAVDQAVAHRRIDPEVEVEIGNGETAMVRASDTVTITGPEIAASDAKISADVLVALSGALTGMVAGGQLSPDAAAAVARKGWEDFMGVPYRPELDRPDADKADVAAAVEEAHQDGTRGGLALLG